MAVMEGCVFCQIVAGETGGIREFEDDDLVVIPDKFPSAPIHLLFISKKHGEEFHKMDRRKLGRMLSRVRVKAIEVGVPYRVVMNGMGATLVPDHLHIHLLGNVTRDRVM